MPVIFAKVNSLLAVGVGGGKVTTPYQRGRSKEYKVMSILRGDGWFCSRSAMSHGPVDVFAARNGKVLVIQVKSGKARIGRKESSVFIQWAKAFDAMGEVWQFRGRKGVERKVLYMNGNKAPLEIIYNGRKMSANIVNHSAA